MLQKMFIVKFLVFNCIIKIKKNKKTKHSIKLRKGNLSVTFSVFAPPASQSL